MGSGSLVPDFSGFTEDAPAALALNKRGSPFYGNQGDKEKRDVGIHPLQAGLIQAAGLAHPGGVIQGHGLGLYAANKEEHGFLPCLKMLSERIPRCLRRG